MIEEPSTPRTISPPGKGFYILLIAAVAALAIGLVLASRKDDSPLAAAGSIFGPSRVALDLPTWLRQQQGKPPLGFAPAGGHGDLVRAFYTKRQDQPAWFVDGRLRPEAGQLVEFVSALADEALTPADYRPEALASGIALVGEGDAEPGQAEELEVGLTWAALLAAAHLHRGKVGAEEAGGRWQIERAEVDLVAVVEEGLASGQLAETLRRVGPDHPQFVGLLQALRRYQQIAAGGGWPVVPKGPPLAVGEPGDADRLRALAYRLHAEGFLQAIPAELESAPAPAPTVRPAAAVGPRPPATAGQVVYSEALAEGVRRFQRTRTLEVDGNLGPETQEELNVPVAQRVAQLALNVERWRWVPDDFGRRAVLVNIPGYTLEVVEGQHIVDRMAVVVGDEGWETPVFADRIEHIELNPYWNVPPSILREEVLTAVQRDPGYLMSHDMEVVEGQTDDAPRVSDSLVYAAAEKDSDLRVRQRPGPRNPLGQLKFMFPNTNNIYLHDTPADHLFREPDRTGSHGCIRVERPVDLAATLLGTGWTPQRVQAEIASGARQTLKLSEEVPVYLLYFTAAVQPDGQLELYEDVYGIDAAHRQARVN